ncbi:DNA helicase RecQ [Peribacillus alkalitolerans]|uniref:DNA helicase RecQ n=1 Tax=Peribacillus alkalitolerans TaxID=1550385 RepID=UPI0013D1EA1E|nr:DNA helicase RecQ [Peribacillus alkalitolerans]
MLQVAEEYLKKYFGYSKFRKGQKEAILNVLEKKQSSACIMPTGGGKSICYQIPALMLEGTTLVISPLISLMKDQVDALNMNGIPASYINSSLSNHDIRERLEEAKQGRYKLLYIAPERLQSYEFMSEIKNLEIPLVAVDEAHCISQWGHDFRPSYMHINEMIQKLQGTPIVLALTATATPVVKDDICRLLQIDDGNVVLTGFGRENLSFHLVKGEDKMTYVENYVGKNKTESGIIYASTRKEVDRISGHFRKKGLKIGRYHAGMSDEDRGNEQEAFLQDRLDIIVATSAFGMGINKTNIRFVIHYQMPKDMESYYQEAGRAGRDGEPSECILLYSAQDVQIQRFLIEQNTFDRERQVQQMEKLRQMMDYCHTENCLQSYILRYFGEANPIDCGRCSNCTDTRELVDVTREAQIVLSCLIRMGEKFGKTMVAQVLTASKNKKLLDNNLHSLSTYGMLKDKSIQEVNEFIEFLTSELYIGVTTGQFPTLYVTEIGKEVLLSRKNVLRKTRMHTRQVVQDDELFNHLREIRRSIASNENVPPFVIFSDVSLRDMCNKLPYTLDEFIKVKGVGEQKMQKYGETFISKIRDFCEKNPDRKRQNIEEEEPIKAKTKAPKDSHLETYKMFQSGMETTEIATIRNITEDTVGSHLLRCVEEGYELDWERLVSNETEEIIRETVQKVGKDKLKPIKEEVPKEISYSTIKIVLGKWRLETSS